MMQSSCLINLWHSLLLRCDLPTCWHRFRVQHPKSLKSYPKILTPLVHSPGLSHKTRTLCVLPGWVCTFLPFWVGIIPASSFSSSSSACNSCLVEDALFLIPPRCRWVGDGVFCAIAIKSRHVAWQLLTHLVWPNVLLGWMFVNIWKNPQTFTGRHPWHPNIHVFQRQVARVWGWLVEIKSNFRSCLTFEFVVCHREWDCDGACFVF